MITDCKYGYFFSILSLALLLGGAGPALAAQADRSKAGKAPPATTNQDDAGPWLLAGREGECVPISILAKKGPEYDNVQSPYQLVEKLRKGGHPAEIKQFNAGTRPAVEVRSPSAGLAVMFVKKELCDKPPPAPEKKK